MGTARVLGLKTLSTQGHTRTGFVSCLPARARPEVRQENLVEQTERCPIVASGVIVTNSL
jgi:hypothetical protein